MMLIARGANAGHDRRRSERQLDPQRDLALAHPHPPCRLDRVPVDLAHADEGVGQDRRDPEHDQRDRDVDEPIPTKATRKAISASSGIARPALPMPTASELPLAAVAEIEPGGSAIASATASADRARSEVRCRADRRPDTEAADRPCRRRPIAGRCEDEVERAGERCRRTGGWITSPPHAVVSSDPLRHRRQRQPLQEQQQEQVEGDREQDREPAGDDDARLEREVLRIDLARRARRRPRRRRGWRSRPSRRSRSAGRR